MNEMKAVRFGMKFVSDALPTNFITITPSVDCDTQRNPKYRALMEALNLTSANDLLGEAVELVPGPGTISVDDLLFSWDMRMPESESYPFVQDYLRDKWNIAAAIIAEGKGLADGLLYATDIFTLRPSLRDRTAELKKTGNEPKFKFRIKGRTDLAVFHEGAKMTRTALLWAIEVKPKKNFSSIGDINRALREGVMQLIGMNADNHYSSPSVIVTALMQQHFILYLERDASAEIRLMYHLRIKKATSFAAAIAFVQELAKNPCISGNFASPPTPSNSPPQGSPEKETAEDDDYDYDDSNVQIFAAEECAQIKNLNLKG
jgi:hypothetical protein